MRYIIFVNSVLYWVVCFEHPVFELRGSQEVAVRVHFTSTGDKVYGSVPEGKGQSAHSDKPES